MGLRRLILCSNNEWEGRRDWIFIEKLNKGSLQRTDNGGPPDTWARGWPVFYLSLTVKEPGSVVLLFRFDFNICKNQDSNGYFTWWHKG